MGRDRYQFPMNPIDDLINTAAAALLSAGGDVLRELDVKHRGSFAWRIEGRLLLALYERHGYSWRAVAQSLGRKEASGIQSAVARHTELAAPLEKK